MEINPNSFDQLEMCLALGGYKNVVIAWMQSEVLFSI